MSFIYPEHHLLPCQRGWHVLAVAELQPTLGASICLPDLMMCRQQVLVQEHQSYSTQKLFCCSSSAGAFVRAGSISLQDAAQQACSRPGYNATALTYDCALFARKFPSYTASAAQHLLASCGSGLNITNDGVCDEGAEEIPHQRVSSAGAHVARRMLRGDEDAWPQHLIDVSERWGGKQQEGLGAQQHIPAWLEDRL